MTFGQYKNQLIEDVPPDYLAWVLKECKNAPPWLLDGIREHLMGNRKKASNPPPPPPPGSGMLSKADLDSKLKQWHRGLALDYHPDRRKGDGVAMSAINDAHDRLRGILDV